MTNENIYQKIISPSQASSTQFDSNLSKQMSQDKTSSNCNKNVEISDALQDLTIICEDERMICDQSVNQKEKLSDNNIMAAISCLKKQFPTIGGLSSCLSLASGSNISSDRDHNIKENSVLICHAVDHWVTISNMEHIANGKWVLFDSLNDEKYVKDPILKQVYKKIIKAQDTKSRFEIMTVKMRTIQKDVFDCGLFAIAYAIELCQLKNPAKIKFNQDCFRKNFNECLKNNFFKSFDRFESDDDQEPVYRLHKINQACL